MDRFTLSPAHFDSLLKRYGITPGKNPSAQWERASSAQRWSLAKAIVKKTLAWMAGRHPKNGQQQILKAYDGQWKKKAFSRYLPQVDQGGAPWQWGDLKWVMSNEAGAAVRLLFLEEALNQLNPSSVLEVGAGNGINLLVLAARFPLIKFSGIEPTSGGVETAKLVIEDGELPDALVSFSPFPLSDVSAPARIRMEQGSAEHLPYADASVDVVMTSLALEQMEEIRHEALSEIARVAKDWVVMLEPFRDVNQSGQRRAYVRTYDYFQGSIAELARYGLKVEQVCLDMPHKSILGTALVLARRIR
ncbi:Methyltransferase domain-containing protein [Polaromonas sp. YR568]|uniref:class I SAM-dependent methyltransferase n=1 Tax=Polaromonas sp. YR568 TaxID=1855301 RepID=UPI0008EB92D3|nr:class I SAM-dependent methyltransferase [Polaromonas sp. YR568]SFU91588.1 Methyltransferase domain-containing protein [Polaromonas sp. YR568]